MTTVEDEAHVMLVLGLLMDQARGLVLARDPGGLRPSRLRIIAHVPRRGGVSVTELAERVGMTKQATGQFVTSLVGDGYLTVAPDPDDGRVRVVRRTRRGTAATDRLARSLRGLEADWAARVGERRYRAFRRTLDELAGLG